MRFIAVCAVVWIHTPETIRDTIIWARWSVPFFTIASIWLIGKSLAARPNQPFWPYARRRTIRLYGTFLLWNAIYLLLIAFKHAAFHTGKPIVLVPDLFWGGSAEHLWFLTFLCVASAAVFPLIQLATRGRVFAIAISSLAIIGFVAVSFSTMPNLGGLNPGTGAFWGNVWMALPALCIGVAMASLRAGVPATTQDGGTNRLSIAAAVCGVIVFSVSLFHLVQYGRDAGWEGLSGFGAMLICFAPVRGPVKRGLASLGQYAFGIYVIHVMWVELLQVLCVRVGIAASPPLDIAVAIVATLISLLMCWLLRNSRLMPR